MKNKRLLIFIFFLLCLFFIQSRKVNAVQNITYLDGYYVSDEKIILMYSENNYSIKSLLQGEFSYRIGDSTNNSLCHWVIREGNQALYLSYSNTPFEGDDLKIAVIDQNDSVIWCYFQYNNGLGLIKRGSNGEILFSSSNIDFRNFDNEYNTHGIDSNLDTLYTKYI